jgi:outer membrane protein assembly factor BamB
MIAHRWLAGALAALCLFSFAQAGDWPQWRGLHRDGRVTGFTPPAAWPTELTKKWSVPVGDGVATPSLVGDSLFVFARQDGKEILRSLDAATGQQRWENGYAAEGAVGPAGRFAGPRASPTVVAGKVFTLGVRGTVSCVDATSGETVWRRDDFPGSWPRFFTSSSPIVVADLCIVQVGSEESGGIVAYDVNTGDQRWKWTGEGPGYASPVLLSVDGGQVIVAETDKSIVGLGAADGALRWQIPYSVQGRGYNASTPIIDGQAVIYSGSDRGTKAAKIEKQGDTLAATELWSNADNSVQFNSPVLKDGLLYGLSGSDVLFCLRTQDGQTLWTAPLGAAVAEAPPQQPPGPRGPGRGRGRGGRSRGGYGSIVDAGAVLVALTPAANLVVFEPSAEGFKQLASYKVAESETYAYPVLSDKRLYIKDQDTLTLWTLE